MLLFVVWRLFVAALIAGVFMMVFDDCYLVYVNSVG